MRTYKTEALIIKRRNIGEADKLLTVFTKDQGKLSIKATGIRRVPSRRSAHVELLNNTVLTLYQGKRYATLIEATALETFSLLKEDLHKIGLAYHICELIDGLCPEGQEHRSVYFLLHDTLRRLSLCSRDDQQESLIIIHGFEIELLTALGYWHRPFAISKDLDTQSFIENILERRLKSKRIFQKTS